MRIFLSYARDNRDAVESLASDLGRIEYEHFEPFFDKQLAGGHPWWEELLVRIQNCELFVPVLSAQYLESKPCALEAEYAHLLNKPFLPVAVEAVSPALFHSYIAETQWLSYGSSDKNSIFELMRALKDVPACPPLPVPMPAHPAAPVSDLTQFREQIDSPEELSSSQQFNLSAELRARLGGPDDLAVRSLLEKLAKRRDLVPRVADEVNRALADPARKRRRRRANTRTPSDGHDGSRTRSIWPFVSAVIAIVVVIGGALYLAFRPRGGYPNRAEAALLQQVPGSMTTAQCARDHALTGTSHVLAAVTCHRSTASTSADQFDTLTYRQFDSDTALTTAFNQGVDVAKPQQVASIFGDCADRPLAIPTYESLDGYGGQMLCFQTDGKANLWFTIAPRRILGEAVRNDTNSSALYAWFSGLVKRDLPSSQQVSSLEALVPSAYRASCLFDDLYFDDPAGNRAPGVDCLRPGDSYDVAYFQFPSNSAMYDAYNNRVSLNRVAPGSGSTGSCPAELSWHNGLNPSVTLGRILCVQTTSNTFLWFTNDATNVLTYLGRSDTDTTALFSTWGSVEPLSAATSG